MNLGMPISPTFYSSSSLKVIDIGSPEFSPAALRKGANDGRREMGLWRANSLQLGIAPVDQSPITAGAPGSTPPVRIGRSSFARIPATMVHTATF